MLELVLFDTLMLCLLLLPFRQHVGSVGNRDGEDTGPVHEEAQIRIWVTPGGEE